MDAYPSQRFCRMELIVGRAFTQQKFPASGRQTTFLPGETYARVVVGKTISISLLIRLQQ